MVTPRYQRQSIAVTPLLAVMVALLTRLPVEAELTTEWAWYNTNTTVSSVPLTIPMFDTDGGRFYLTSVTISFYEDSYASFAVDNEHRANRQWTATPREIRAWNISGPGVTQYSNTTWNANSVIILGRDDKDPPTPDYQPPDGYNWGRVGYDNASRGSLNVGESYFSQYQADGGGNTSFNLNVTTINNLILWSPSPPNHYHQLIQDGNPNLSVKVRVDYEWEQVPEPGTWALMGLGLGAVIIWRRHISRA